MSSLFRPASFSHRAAFAVAAALLLPGPVSASSASTTAAHAAPSSAPAAPDEAIRRIDGERISALLKGDFAALKGLIHPDCVYTHASGLVESGADYIRRLERGDLRYLAMQYAQAPAVRTYDNHTAVVSGRVQLTSQGREPATPNHRVMITTAIYARQGAAWQMVSFQSTPAPSPAP